jgi:hypothetical protein
MTRMAIQHRRAALIVVEVFCRRVTAISLLVAADSRPPPND